MDQEHSVAEADAVVRHLLETRGIAGQPGAVQPRIQSLLDCVTGALDSPCEQLQCLGKSCVKRLLSEADSILDREL